MNTPLPSARKCTHLLRGLLLSPELEDYLT
jgi:hypothetical protein